MGNKSWKMELLVWVISTGCLFGDLAIFDGS